MYALTPPEEIRARIAKLQERLRQAGLDAAFLVQSADLFYFAGSIQQGILVVRAQGDPTYFARRVFERAVEESPLPEIRKIGSLKDVSAYYAGKGAGSGSPDLTPIAETLEHIQEDIVVVPRPTVTRYVGCCFPQSFGGKSKDFFRIA